jgi:hypothetical protein
MCAACQASSVACAPPDLGRPADGLETLGLWFEAQVQRTAALGGLAAGPGAFHQGPSGMGVTGLGQRPLLAPLAGGLC